MRWFHLLQWIKKHCIGWCTVHNIIVVVERDFNSVPGRNSTAHFVIKMDIHRFSKDISSTKARLVSEIQSKTTAKNCLLNILVFLSLAHVTAITPTKISTNLIISRLLTRYSGFYKVVKGKKTLLGSRVSILAWRNLALKIWNYSLQYCLCPTRSFKFGLK